ncbi:hypothetical protein R1sor_018437 [Riccia sorocarpa]|uniref:YdbS-like PH domain-containing protein n=1 Tax=Riccia sorocarpa TaxID=122646 RepID=A0ABD3IDD9_9MARC
MMAARALSSTGALAHSLSLSSRNRSGASSQQPRHAFSPRWSHSFDNQLMSLNRITQVGQFSSISSPIQVREFSKIVARLARSPVASSGEKEEVFFDGDRKDFSYEVVKEARFIPRFIGEWGDLVIELKDGTLVDLRCVPKFREIAAYVNERAGKKLADPSVLTSSAPAATSAPKKGFST